MANPTPHFNDRAHARGGHSKDHPGFNAVAKRIAAKEGVSRESAGAILGAAARGARPAAKKANPRLKRVE
jgi:hypothetical protein